MTTKIEKQTIRKNENEEKNDIKITNRPSGTEDSKSSVVLFKFEERESTAIEIQTCADEQKITVRQRNSTVEVNNNKTFIGQVANSPYNSLVRDSGISTIRPSETNDHEDDIDDIDMDYEYHIEKPRVELPAMEIVIQNLSIAKERSIQNVDSPKLSVFAHNSIMDKKNTETVLKKASTTDIDYSLCAQIQMDLYNSSFEQCLDFDEKKITENKLTAREQEEADESIRRAVRYMLDNKFLKAKSVLQSNACR
ncbi:hypothetical protein BDF20DRAFT_373611 [Mycotypha africana]|uniref:uncharacterized protein n=1 Tax=Mycotypha africana TaxID=64632 RepID=UPI0023000CE0|nr:uncharacterized protein BDF20DRAFT_373611 [Mycotypha africana]KAI8984244.1 hypothetical protein BDF20DRAFT_373611 [Mycotypha africana]